MARKKTNNDLLVLQNAWDSAKEHFDYEDNRKLRNVAIRGAFILTLRHGYTHIVQDDIAGIIERNRSVLVHINRRIDEGWYDSISTYHTAKRFFAEALYGDFSSRELLDTIGDSTLVKRVNILKARKDELEKIISENEKKASKAKSLLTELGRQASKANIRLSTLQYQGVDTGLIKDIKKLLR